MHGCLSMSVSWPLGLREDRWERHVCASSVATKARFDEMSAKTVARQVLPGTEAPTPRCEKHRRAAAPEHCSPQPHPRQRGSRSRNEGSSLETRYAVQAARTAPCLRWCRRRKRRTGGELVTTKGFDQKQATVGRRRTGGERGGGGWPCVRRADAAARRRRAAMQRARLGGTRAARCRWVLR